MTGKQTAAPQAPGTNPGNGAPGTPDTTPEPAIDWGTLASVIPLAADTTPAGRTINVIAEIPEPIRQRAELSLAENTRRVAVHAAKIGTRARVNYRWDLQQVATVKMGEKFAAALVRYSKYRPANVAIPHREAGTPDGQVTARCGAPAWFKLSTAGEAVPCSNNDEGAFLGVRYSVMPFEQRKATARLPGTTTS